MSIQLYAHMLVLGNYFNVYEFPPSSTDDVTNMERTVKEMAKQEAYKQKLVESYQQATMNCLTEVQPACVDF